MENISLFGQEGQDLQAKTKIDVVKAAFIEADRVSWDDLFDGFDKLYAITYSSGIDFVCKLLRMFDSAEIIFGFDNVISPELHETIAFQTVTIERLKEKSSKNKIDMMTRIDNGTLRLYVSRGQVSHEKIYMLSADDGRRRVIMGSANMSYPAFSGLQRENICYMDGGEAFDWYFDRFEELKTNSTDDITAQMLTVSDFSESVEMLPISKTVEREKVLVVEPRKDPQTAENIKFTLDVKNLSNRYSSLVPKADKDGKIKIAPTQIRQISRKREESVLREKELRKEYPQLVVDMENAAVSLNGQAFDLRPDRDDVANDIRLFIEYMDGYEKFHGDTELMQRRYFEFANWFFASPFLAAMRNAAVINNQPLLPYPMFGIVYGKSKAGKTSFLETLLKMMIGNKIKISAPDFTRKDIKELMYNVKGMPIIVDDLTQARFNQHAVETIKNDDFGVAEGLTNYPAVVISANEDIKAVAPEIVRRTVICRIDAGLKNTELMKSKTVRRVQQHIGTAFYREYLRRMLETIPEMIEDLKHEDNDAPDILAVSSQMICEIVADSIGNSIPLYIRELALDDYFGEKVTGLFAIKAIRNAWEINKKAFVIDKKAGQLRYNTGDYHEASRFIKELPEDLEAHKSRDWIAMDLDKAIEFFGVSFKKSLF